MQTQGRAISASCASADLARPEAPVVEGRGLTTSSDLSPPTSAVSAHLKLDPGDGRVELPIKSCVLRRRSPPSSSAAGSV